MAEARIIREILVDEGDSVEQGHVLIRLDPTVNAVDTAAIARERSLEQPQLRRIESELADTAMKREAADAAELYAQVDAQRASHRQEFIDSLAEENAARDRALNEPVASRWRAVAADSATELAEGVLELKQGASTAEIMAVYPAARQMTPSHIAVVATTGFWGARSAMGDIFILTVDQQAGFSSVDFQISAEDVYELVQGLKAGLGDSRSAAARTIFGAFQHAHEWSTPAFGVRVAYTTMHGASQSPVVGMGAVQVQRGPLTRSLVDQLQGAASQPVQIP